MAKAIAAAIATSAALYGARAEYWAVKYYYSSSSCTGSPYATYYEAPLGTCHRWGDYSQYESVTCDGGSLATYSYTDSTCQVADGRYDDIVFYNVSSCVADPRDPTGGSGYYTYTCDQSAGVLWASLYDTSCCSLNSTGLWYFPRWTGCLKQGRMDGNTYTPSSVYYLYTTSSFTYTYYDSEDCSGNATNDYELTCGECSETWAFEYATVPCEGLASDPDGSARLSPAAPVSAVALVAMLAAAAQA